MIFNDTMFYSRQFLFPQDSSTSDNVPPAKIRHIEMVAVTSSSEAESSANDLPQLRSNGAALTHCIGGMNADDSFDDSNFSRNSDSVAAIANDESESDDDVLTDGINSDVVYTVTGPQIAHHIQRLNRLLSTMDSTKFTNHRSYSNPEIQSIRPVNYTTCTSPTM